MGYLLRIQQLNRYDTLGESARELRLRASIPYPEEIAALSGLPPNHHHFTMKMGESLIGTLPPTTECVTPSVV